MPKYLLQINYTVEGTKGVIKDGGTVRVSAAHKAAESLGGHIESMYFALGDTDCFVVADMPDHASVVAITMALAASGGATAKTTALLTPEEMDQATRKSPTYKSPGQ